MAETLNCLLDTLPKGSRKGSKKPVLLDEEARQTFDNLVSEMYSLPILSLPVADPSTLSILTVKPSKSGFLFLKTMSRVGDGQLDFSRVNSTMRSATRVPLEKSV